VGTGDDNGHLRQETDDLDPWDLTAAQWAAYPLDVVQHGAAMGVPLAVADLQRRATYVTPAGVARLAGMGTIDSATFTLTCPNCGRTESNRILDKGNMWSGSDWRRPSFETFDVTVTGGYRDVPEVVGECPQCKVAAVVAMRYAT